MAERKFKGFKVEVASVYNQLSVEDKLDYMWFVRDDENSKSGKIYFGSRLYAGDATSEDFESLKGIVANLGTKIDAVDTKVDANSLRIDAANEKMDVISEKIDVVKDEASVVYQKIDDIYEDSNHVREDVAEMQKQVAEAVETVNAMDKKIDDETARAEAAETQLQANIDAEKARAEEAEKKNASDIATVNTNLVTAVENINKNVADGFNTINGGIATEIEERKAADAELDANKVSWMSKDDKRIVLDNHKNLLGTSTEGNTYNLAMVSKWDIADFGSTHIPLNLNSSVVPTVQLFGQTGEQAKHIAFAEDVVTNEALEAEKARALEAEANLQTNINDVRNALDISVAGLQSNINVNAEAIKAENARALEAEANLQTNINDVRNALDLSVEGLQANINANTNAIEATRVALDNETARATEAEAQLQANIDAEKVRAEEAEKKNASDIATVNTNLVAAVETLNKNMADGFNTINGGIDNEIRPVLTELKDADAKLAEDLTAEAKRVDGMISQVNENIATVVTTLNQNMADGFNTINGGINNEIRPAIEALEAQIDTAVEDVELVQDIDDPLKYTLMVDGEPAGEIQIPKDQFLKSVVYDSDTKELIFTFSADEGDVVSKVNIAELVDTYTAGDGLQVADNKFSLKVDPATQAYIEVDADGIRIIGVDEKLAEKVSWTDISTQDNQNRKAIVLKNHDTILGTSTNGTTSSILMLNKWDVVDLGTASLPINLNTPAGVRPTVQEQGQTGEQANKIAYVSDVEAATASIEALKVELQNEVSARTEADTNLQTALNEEVTARGAAIEAVNKAIAEETTARGAADTQLQENISAEGQARIAAIEEVNKAVEDEVAARGAADTQLQENISAEAQARIAAIEAVNKAIAEEVTARGAADTQLQENISAEGQARIAAIEEVNKAVEDEVTARGAADTQLQSDLQAEATQRAEDDNAIKETLELKADKTEIPTTLPNPNALTIKYNGVEAFTYDGSASETGNFIVNAETVTMSDTDTKTIATKISEMDEEIAKKVTWESAATDEMPDRKKISLNNHDIIVGKGTDNVEYAIAMISKWDKVDLGTASLPINLNTPAGVRPTVQEQGQTGEQANEIAYVEDLRLMPKEIQFPLRSLSDKVYTQEEILEWFGVPDVPTLKTNIAYGGFHYVKYGILLSGNPHYYTMPVEYLAFESATQIKLVFAGLDTSNDAPVKYEIIINLNGTVIEGNCNVKVTMSDFALASDVTSQILGDLDLTKYMNDNEYSIQVLNKLEQSYIDDLGTPENINGKPYNADTNNYLVGQPYLSFAKFDESLVFHYDLYILNGLYNMGYLGKVFQAMNLNLDTYDSKLAKIEERLTALEGAGA